MLTIRGMREVQAGGASCHRQYDLIGRRPAFEGWRGPARRVLVILVFLAELLLPAANGHGPLFSAPSAAAVDSSLAAANFTMANPPVPCSHHPAEGAGLDGDHGKSPCARMAIAPAPAATSSTPPPSRFRHQTPRRRSMRPFCPKPSRFSKSSAQFVSPPIFSGAPADHRS